MCCFLTVGLPDSLAVGVTAVQDWLPDADGLRSVGPEGVRVIPKFLGEVSSNRVGAVEDAVEPTVKAAGVGPLDASVGRSGIFPSPDHTRVVWVDVDGGATKLAWFHEAIERETATFGLDPEGHEFTLYITPARMDGACGKVLVRRVIEGEPPTVGSFRVHEIHLKKSDLGLDGPEHEAVVRAPLQGT